jgi:lysophospholipase L1-like esterase
VLLVLTMLGTVSALEGLLRWSVPPSDVNLFEFTTATPRFKVMRPNIRGVVYGVPFETNAWGFRDDRAWSRAKEEGELRIVVLGDSATVAAGVPFSGVYSQVLQSVLRQRLSDRLVNVLNLGVGGYDVVQYLHVFREVGLSLKPDYVVVGVFPLNDFDDTDRRGSEAIARGGAGAAQQPVAWYESLYLYRAYGRKVMHLARSLRQRDIAPGRARPASGAPTTAAPSQNWAALASVGELAREHQIPLVVVLLPYASDFRRQRPWHEPVAAACAEHGIPWVDMLDAFIESGIPGRRFRLNLVDDHPDGAYNRVVGERLAAYLTERLRDRAERTR